ncbi:RNA polymerase sigma factor [Pedobacter sp. BS3]|uniref:RNA polymerase sigma factor n=1 Tax=Pedobacter sp. BS3 TaxID=2567937 RepID=UPI001F5B52B2|nr:sigma-70 family RNA polymerase sigma factor [Pedobacter sp. BS3]
MFNEYKNRIFTFVDNYIHSKADAEEIVQETFLILWQNRRNLLAIEHPRNYIYTIARNKTYDYLTKTARNEKMLNQTWINLSVSYNDIDDKINLSESKRIIEKALTELSEQKQAVFNMSRSENMNHDEIARVMGLSKSRVKNIIVEVLKHLKYRLSKSAFIIAFVLVVKQLLF